MGPLITEPDAEAVFSQLCNLLPADEGFECARFKIGSYNAIVDPAYRLPYEPNALAILVLNTPKFFETSFKHWLQSQRREGEEFNDFARRFGCNILRKYFSFKFARIQQDVLPIQCDVIHDFDFYSDGRPKVLLTTCGHVAGAAYFYLPRVEVNNNSNENNMKLPSKDPFHGPPARPMGLSLHPKYGGYFAFRGVFVFSQVHLPESFVEVKPKMTLGSVKEQMKAIELFNLHWLDGRFRDCGCSGEKYSKLQQKFYSVPPAERWPLLRHWFC